MTEDLLGRIRELSPPRQALLEQLLLRQPPERAGSAAIAPRDRSRPCALSPFQERIWFLEQLDPGVPLYHKTWAARLRGPLDVGGLETALNVIVERHESLRMAIRVVDGIPTQVFHASRPVRIARIDLAGRGGESAETVAGHLLREEARRPFDLAGEPLVRATVLRLGETDHVFALTLHHLASDDWSMRVLLQELSLFYTGAVQGTPVSLPPVPVQFGDVAAWQRERLESASAVEDIAYWTAQLGSVLPVLDLPADRPRPAKLSHRGATRAAGLGPVLSARLREVSRSEGASLFVLLLAAFVTLLSRYSNREDIVLGIPITNRDRPELESLIGPLLETMVLRVDLAGTHTFREVLRRTRRVLASAYAHRTLPFDRLVDVLRPDRALDHTPVFQVMLGWVEPDSQMRSLRLPRLTVSPVEVDRGTSKFDLTLLVTEIAGEIVGDAEYSTDLFDSGTIEQLLRHFGALLEGIAANPGEPWWQLPLLTGAERHQLVVEWNDTRRDYPADRTVHSLFAAQATETPDAVAIVFEDQRLTYRELDRRANQLAHHLRALGVGPEVRVGLLVERSPEMAVGLLGILKAGGAYVPLDPAYPRTRLAFMVDDTEAPVLLTLTRLRDQLPAPSTGRAAATRIVCLDADWPVIAQASDAPPVDQATPESLAYVMYTSGSRGVPKGVCVTHRAVVRLVRNTDYARLAADEVFLQLAPLAFDASSFEIWGSLLNGARLAIYPPDVPSVEGLLRAVRRYRVTTLWLTAAFFHQVVDHAVGDLEPVRQLLSGG